MFPHWTINDILEQPEALLNTVVSLKSTGLRMARQIEDEKKGKV